MFKIPTLAAAAFGVVFLSAFNAAPATNNGTTDKDIVLGQSCALKGPAAGLGKGMQEGLRTYFDAQNERGGVHGRKITLLSVNDGYEPKKAAKATRMLIEKKKVFMMIGEVGTPTSKVAVPICEENNIAFIAPFTGAEFLRAPFKPQVVNLRGSYYQEMERLAEYLVDKKGLKKIACFYQNDGYGKAGLSGIEIALKARGLALVSTGTYERNTVAVATGVKSVAAGNPDAVIMVGAYKPCAAAIKSGKANPALSGALFCNISFVGTKNLIKALGDDSEGCIVSQVVPYPWDTSLPLVKEYQEAMKKRKAEASIGFVTLEGYMAGKFYCQVLEHVQGELTTEKFLAAVTDKGSFDLGGVTLEFGENDNQGMDKIYLTEFKGGKILPLK